MEWLLERFESAPERTAFIHRGRRISYGEVVAKVREFSAMISREGVAAGHMIAVLGDYSPEVFCFILACALRDATVTPLTRESVVDLDTALSICGGAWIAEFDDDGVTVALRLHRVPVDNPLLGEFKSRGHPGLVLFSSGSTGKPKGILHDLVTVAEKFRKPRKPVVAIAFLMIDHFGGINTILAITSSLGTVVTVADRSPESICKAIEEAKVELLPATPSFLTMLIASGLHRQYDLSSLQRITYGTEVMPQPTLDRLREIFPEVELQQTYGLSEVGVLRSQSRPDGSLWVRLGGEGFETKVVDDILWIRSRFAMVGYLNAPPPFDHDGWFNTQDRVEVDGEWFRILGRVTDIINVGGQKVYPAEVENIILELEEIEDVAVFGESHPLLGQVVVAKVLPRGPMELSDLKKKLRRACRERLAPFMVPAKVVLADAPLHTARHKKSRRAPG